MEKTLVLSIMAVFLSGCAFAQNRAPVWVNDMDGLVIFEDTVIGTSVYTLLAEDESDVRYYTDTEVFIVDEFTGEVILNQNLDYESGTIKYTIKLYAVDSQGLDTLVEPTINVYDSNDNDPRFSRDNYGQTIPEDFSIGFTVVSNLLVTDEDFKGAKITVTCDPYMAVKDNTSVEFAQYEEACLTFEPVEEISSNKRWIGNIELLKELDFETRWTYQIPLVSSDGTNRHLQTFEIILQDVNDTPPRFFNVTESVDVQENTPPGTVIGWSEAVDGDKGNRREIQYETTPCNMTGSNRRDGISAFTVDRYDGAIRTNTTLDHEEELFSVGLVLCIKARELDNKTSLLGDDDITTATTTVRINVVDLNDEIPTFALTNYDTSIYENVINGSPVPGVALTVTDRDGISANEYTVFLVTHGDIFEVSPSSGKGRSISGIKVKDTSRIDYESPIKKYEVIVVAEESGRGSDTATVTIHVLDRNDNSPMFTQNSYDTTVNETNPGTEPFISNIQAFDPDSGWFGTAGIRYSLLGSEQEKFEIVTDSTRGIQIKVRPCATPGRSPCLDYEKRRRYVFTLRARDMHGDDRGREGTADVTINLVDENDSKPEFTLNSYRGSIEEGSYRTVDSIYVRANDDDHLSNVRYSLEASNQSRYWQINSYDGFISAKEPIFYRFTPDSQGWFDLTVIADDGIHKTTASVRIDVIDKNTFPPVFDGVPYTTSILENTTGGVYVFTVRATDEDPEKADNGRVEYNIELGAKGKFVVNVTSGDIYTAPGATFDYDVEKDKPYILTVLARDGGNPQLTGTATLTVSILDMNNKLPFFTPGTRFANVSENKIPPTLVTTISATDLDAEHKLVYDLIEPVEAINPDGVLVDRTKVDYLKMFSLNRTTGEVRVAGKLDRDLTSRITYTMKVTDIYDPNNPQIGETGQLQIHILEYNDQSPVFQQAVYNLTVEEEQAIGTFIMALVAQDEDDAIDRYEIVERDRDLLAVQRNGVLNVNKRLDYETIKRTEFTVRAWDTGSPQRSATAKVYVSFVNINDNSPMPEQGTYSLRILEHTAGGTSLLNVSATDKDDGDYGEVRYSLPDSVTLFNIDNRTGDLRLSDDAVLDREAFQTVSIRITIYDSPKDDSVRRTYNVPVYISLEDINDNAPVFSSTEYISAEIIESIDIGAQILQVFATDRDFGINAQLVYTKLPNGGDPDDLFTVTPRSGQIIVAKSLRGLIGIYRFNISVSDMDGQPGHLTAYARVTITVIESLNSAPDWFIPADDNATVEVLESQYLGMLVFDVHANDSNRGNNGIVEYFLQDAEREVSSTKEFSINQITGVIRAEMVFDRETVDKYTLHLVAKDKGDPPLRTERFLNIIVADVNDNEPEFEMANGVVVTKSFKVMENASLGDFVGRVSATDKDSDRYSKIYYHLIAGDQGKFAVNISSGAITLIGKLDRENKGSYSLRIRASNGESDDRVITKGRRRRRSTDPSIIFVVIDVLDVNDEPPQFTNFNGPGEESTEYYGCISTTPAFDRPVVQLSALDKDFNDASNIKYDIIAGNTNTTFQVDENGLVTNRRLFRDFSQRVFNLTASATDHKWTSQAPVMVFVTEDATEAKIVINKNQEQVQQIRGDILRLLHSIEEIRYGCVMRITNHLAASAVATKSDVYISAAVSSGTGYRLLTSTELLNLLKKHRKTSPTVYTELFVEPFENVERVPVYDNKPVLVVMIVVILLIFLAVLLLCLVCYCLRMSDKRKEKNNPRDSPTPEYGEDVNKVNPLYTAGPLGDYEPNEHFVDNVDELYAKVGPKKTKHAPMYTEFGTFLPDPDRMEPTPFPIIETTVLESDVDTVSRPDSDEFDAISVEVVPESDLDQDQVVFETILPEPKGSESDTDSMSDHTGSFSPLSEPYQQIHTGLTPLEEQSETYTDSENGGSDEGLNDNYRNFSNVEEDEFESTAVM